MSLNLLDKIDKSLGEYLHRVSTPGEGQMITEEVAIKAWCIWSTIWSYTGGKMPLPSASTGPDGIMFFSWDKDEHHLEIEMFPGRETEFFYLNRKDNSELDSHICANSDDVTFLFSYLNRFYE